jgi:antirestriction protein
MEVRIYITNLAKYNKGKLVGKWVELPMDKEELKREIKEVLGNEEEIFLSDFESPFDIEEYENPFTLNEFVEQLDKLDEYEQEKVFYLMDTIGYDREETLEHYEDVTYYQDMTLDDVAYELVEEGVFGELTDSIKSYLDYEKLARDLRIDGYYETDKGVFWYQ